MANRMADAHVCPDERSWQAYLADRLSEDAKSRIDAHVNQCARCATRLELDACLPMMSMAEAIQRAARRSSLSPDGNASPPTDSALTRELKLDNRGFLPTEISFSPLHPSPATMIAPDRTVVVGTYELIEWLGTGGVGAVYRARQVSLKRWVAVKMLRPQSTYTEDAVRRLVEEARRMAQLRHDNVVQVIDVGEHNGWPFFSMELIEDGKTLAKTHEKTPFTPTQSADLMISVADAVQAAHNVHIYHRDLKPSNILLTSDNRPKVTDFGLAITRDELMNRGFREVAGTAVYMAPEQWDGQLEEIGAHTDVYGLGAILYELLTGRPPFPIGENKLQTRNRVLYDRPELPRRIQSRVPRDLEAICLKCLEKNPKDRYSSALEVAEDLKRFRKARLVKARPVGLLGQALYFQRRNWPWLAVAACAIAILGGLVMFSRSENRKLQLNEASAAFNQGVSELTSGYSKEGFALIQTAIEKSSGLDADRSRYYESSAEAWRKRLPREIGSRAHSSIIVRAVISPNGEQVLFSDDHNAVWLWTLKTDALSEIQPPRNRRISILAFSHSGSRFAVGTGSETHIWSVSSREKICVSAEPFYYLNTFVFLGDDRFATGTADNNQPIRFWRLNSPRAEPIATHIPIQGAALQFASASDGSAFVARTKDGCWLWRGDGSPVIPLSRDKLDISNIAFAPNGETLAAISEENQLLLFSVSDGTVSRRISLAPAQKVHKLAFHGNSAVQLILELDRELIRREIPLEFTARDDCPISPEGSQAIDESGAGTRFATGVTSKTIQIWEPPAASWRTIALSCMPAMAKTSFSIDGSRIATLVRPVAPKLGPQDFGPLGNLGDRRGCLVQIYDRDSFGDSIQSEWLPQNHTGLVISYSPRYNQFAVGCEESKGGQGAVLLGEWSPDHKMQFQTLGNHSSSVCSLQFSPDAERLYSGTYASASRPAELISWRAAKTDNGLKRFQEEHRISIPASIAALDVIEAEGSGCRLLAIGGKDGVIRLRNADDLDHDWRSVVLKGSISILACSSDKHLLAAGTSLGQIVVFRIDDQGITEISDNSGNLAANIAALRFHPQRPELHAGFQTQNSLKVTAWDTNCWQEVGPPKILVGDLIGPSFFLAADRSTIAVIPRTAPFVLFYSLP